MFQGENVLIHMLHSEMLQIIKKMPGYFILIASITFQRHITQIKFNQKELQLCDNDINIGSETRAFLLLH